MRSTKQLSVTLPNEMAARVKAKVQAGEYASESEVIREGLRMLDMRDQAIESWLVGEVGPAIDAVRENPTNVFTSEEVLASIEATKARLRAKPR